MNDEKDPFKGLEEDDVEEDPVQILGVDLSILKERFADQIDADILLDEYVDFDIEVSTSHSKLSNAEIIPEVTGTQEDNSDNEESDNVEGKLTQQTFVDLEYVLKTSSARQRNNFGPPRRLEDILKIS